MKKRLIATIKRTFSLLSATLLVVLLVGCGGEGGESSNYPESLTLVDDPPSPLDKKETYSIAFYRDERKKEKVNVGFIAHSFGTTCKITHVSREHPNKIIVDTDKCINTRDAEVRIVDWVRNNVIGIGWPPPAWNKRYLTTYYKKDTCWGRVDIPDHFQFVIWGQFGVGNFPNVGDGYICDAVMLGFTIVPRTDHIDTTGYYWTFITNTGSNDCYSSNNGFTSTLPIECKNTLTGSKRLLKLGFTDNSPGVSKEPDGFTIELCN